LKGRNIPKPEALQRYVDSPEYHEKKSQKFDNELKKKINENHARQEVADIPKTLSKRFKIYPFEKDEIDSYNERHQQIDFDFNENIFINYPQDVNGFLACLQNRPYTEEVFDQHNKDTEPYRIVHINACKDTTQMLNVFQMLYDSERKPFKITFSYGLIGETEVAERSFNYVMLHPHLNESAMEEKFGVKPEEPDLKPEEPETEKRSALREFLDGLNAEPAGDGMMRAALNLVQQTALRCVLMKDREELEQRFSHANRLLAEMDSMPEAEGTDTGDEGESS
jgi:hypothetical protein